MIRRIARCLLQYDTDAVFCLQHSSFLQHSMFLQGLSKAHGQQIASCEAAHTTQSLNGVARACAFEQVHAEATYH